MSGELILDGRVAVVTGAANGLGRAEALALAQAGARLVLNDLPGDAVYAVLDEIATAGGQAVVAAGDVGEWSTGERLLAAALDAYGRLDILVNNAGVLRDRMVFTMSPDEWDLVIRVHLRGHFVTTRLATAYWREQRNAAGRPGGGVPAGHAAGPVRRAGRDLPAGGLPGQRRVVLLDRQRVRGRRRPAVRAGVLIMGGVLAGRVAVVTGAANGLGRAESLALARAGARLVLNDLPGDAVNAVAAEIAAAGGQAVVAAGDVGEWPTGERLLAAAVGTYGQLDILVNNAGVLRDRMIFSMSEQEWDTVLRVHLRGHFVTTRVATAWWREQSKQAGGPVYARIINTSSEAFLLGSAGQPNYAAAKAGIAALTVTTARSCVRYGVRANAICPRARTAMTADLMGPPPSGEIDPLAPEHVAPLVVYLASPAAQAITGEVFVVHGGVAAVMEPPRVRAVFQAAEHGSPDGMWTLDSVGQALAGLSSGTGFMCEDTLALATETIGFPGRG